MTEVTAALRFHSYLGKAMSVLGSLQSCRLIEHLLEVRSGKHAAAYSLPIILVIGATLLRLLSDGDLIAGFPFTTYFPAIVVTALLSGFGPGVVATLLVSAIAWYPTIPADLSFEAGVWFLLLVLVTGANIIVVAMLDAAVEVIISSRRVSAPAD